jgi:hypothetical protein
MKSKFEEFLKNNRQQLDVESPDDQLIWGGINSELRQKPKSVFRNFWKAAAVILLLMSSGYFIYNEFFKSQPLVYTISLSDIDPNYAVMETNYLLVIDNKMQELGQVSSSSIENITVYREELINLDEMYEEYQHDFVELGENERLIMAMMDYYEKKMRVLDRMLMEIQKQKDYENRQEHTEL